MTEILAVVGVDFAYVSGTGWSMHTTLLGWSASGVAPPSAECATDILTRIRAGEEVPYAIYGAA